MRVCVCVRVYVVVTVAVVGLVVVLVVVILKHVRFLGNALYQELLGPLHFHCWTFCVSFGSLASRLHNRLCIFTFPRIMKGPCALKVVCEAGHAPRRSTCMYQQMWMSV